MKRVALAVSLALPVLLASPPGHAGAQFNTWSCSPGSCAGTFLSVRNAGDPNTFADFYTTTSGGLSFFAEFNGAYYSCSAPAGSSVAALAPEALANEGYFSISWGTNGVCTFLEVVNGSAYHNY
jgi:hypothetical protein